MKILDYFGMIGGFAASLAMFFEFMAVYFSN
jgi:hypothetical protein